MTYDEFISVLTQDVARVLKENSMNILQNLITDLPNEPCITEEQLRVCRSAVIISVQFSVQIIFDYLDSLGMLNYENLQKHHESPELHLLKGGLSDILTD